MDRGMIHVYTGDGKGKTTAAIGLAIRASGYGKKIYFLQFLKGRKSGELESLKKFSNITLRRPNFNNSKFYYQMDDEEKERVQTVCRQAWQEFCNEILRNDYEIIIIDEIMGLLANKILGFEELIDFVKNKDYKQEIILTGRGAPEELIEVADYVTEMKMIKHPFQNNVPGRKGIEF